LSTTTLSFSIQDLLAKLILREQEVRVEVGVGSGSGNISIPSQIRDWLGVIGCVLAICIMMYLLVRCCRCLRRTDERLRAAAAILGGQSRAIVGSGPAAILHVVASMWSWVTWLGGWFVAPVVYFFQGAYRIFFEAGPEVDLEMASCSSSEISVEQDGPDAIRYRVLLQDDEANLEGLDVLESRLLEDSSDEDQLAEDVSSSSSSEDSDSDFSSARTDSRGSSSFSSAREEDYFGDSSSLPPRSGEKRVVRGVPRNFLQKLLEVDFPSESESDDPTVEQGFYSSQFMRSLGEVGRPLSRRRASLAVQSSDED
jgi:hypothetical protein